MSSTPVKTTRRILACDPSISNTGLCLMDSATRKFKTRAVPKPFKDCTQQVVISCTYAVVQSIFRRSNIDLFVLEGYAFAMAGQSSSITVLAELSGCLKLAVMQAGLPMIVVPPTSWKKMVFGKGNLKKPEIREAAIERWPQLADKTQDEIDAYCLATSVADVMHNVDKWRDSDNPIYKELQRTGCFVTIMKPINYGR